MQAEIAAATWVYFSNAGLLRGRRIIHFIDNTGALSAMIFGYARKLDCARMINSFHLLLAALQLRVYFEWVPSDANTSDLPSRALEDGAMDTYYAYFPNSVQGESHIYATARRMAPGWCVVSERSVCHVRLVGWSPVGGRRR